MATPWNFFMNNGCGASYYPSMMTYDMCSGSLMGSMNLHWNQALDHSIAMQSLYMVPQYNFNNFSQYATPMMNNSYLLDPMYTIGQMNWHNLNQFGTGLFGANGQFQFPNMNNVWGWNPSNNINPINSPTANNEEDAKFTEKRNKLQTLLKELSTLISDEELNGEIKFALQNYHKEKGAKAQFEFLKKYYDKISDETMKAIVPKLKVNSQFVKDELEKVGFDYKDGAVDDYIAELHRDIDGAESNGNITDNHILGHLASERSAYSILDVISSWNTQYKDKEERNIIKFIQDNYKEGDVQQNGELKDSAIVPLVDQLCKKAREVMETKIGNAYALDETTRESIDDAIKNVTVDNANLAENFDKLYVILRVATAKIEGAKLEKRFGYLEDTAVFNKDMFIDKTNEDLEAEGLKDVSSDINIGINNDIGKSQSSTPKTAAEEMKSLENKGDVKKLEAAQMAELKKLGVDAETAWVDTKVKDGEQASVYVIKNDKVVEVDNVTVKDNKVQKIDTTAPASTDGAEVKAENVENKAKEVKVEEKAKKEKEDIQTKKKQAYNNGSEVFDIIDGDTDDLEYSRVNELISSNNLTKDNIVEFLDGFYAGDSHEGIIEFLDDEYDDGTITIENKKNIVQALIDKAKDVGIKSSKYSKLQRIIDSEKTNNGKTFNTNVEAWYKVLGRSLICWYNGGLADPKTYNEVIDEEMKKLHAEIKAKEAK